MMGKQPFSNFSAKSRRSFPFRSGEGAFAGYIVEPFQMGDLAEHLRADGATWEIG
jgi:hypothetical protein